MQLISKYNKGIWFLSCIIDIYSKYTRVVPLKDKKGITITNAFQNSRWVKDINLIKYGYMKLVNSITDHWNHGCKTMM